MFLDVLWVRVDERQMEARLGSRPITRTELEGWVAAFEASDAEELALYDQPANG